MTKKISDAVLQHSVSMMLDFLGPFELIGVVAVVINILRTIGTIMQDDVPDGLAGFNTAMGAHTATYREKETPQIVETITKSSIQIDESTKELTAYFFYTKNNVIKAQLRGLNYFAFDSIPSMFKAVFVWNYALDAAKKSGSYPLKKRSTIA